MHYKELLYTWHTELTQGGSDSSLAYAPPIYSTDYKDEKKLIKWLTDTTDLLMREAAPRTQNMFNNIMFYKGIHSLTKYGDTYKSRTLDRTPVSSDNMFVMNHLLEFTQQKVSRLIRYSPNINTFPWNNGYKDKINARFGKKVVQGLFYQHDFDQLLQEIYLQMAICGGSYLFLDWNPNIGPEDKDYESKVAKAERLEYDYTNEAGEKIELAKTRRLGDHSLDIPLPVIVLHEPKQRWADVDYILKGCIKHIDTVKAENARLSNADLENIRTKSSVDGFVNDAFATDNRVLEWTFYHRKTEFVPYGIKAVFFNDTLVSAGDLPFSHGELPVCRMTDYDEIDTAYPRSFYDSLKLPSVMINNMTKIAYRSYAIAAYPKLIVERDTTNYSSLANGPFVVEVDPGARDPKIVSFNAVNNDFFSMNQHVERFMEKNSGTFGISRGDQPANARARSILNFYEEQEAERESTQIRKANAFIEKVARMLYSNTKDNFKPDDNRTIKLVGKNNAYKLIKFNSDTELSTDFDFKVERTTALSESKQGRIDQIATLSNMPLADQSNPGLFTREQVLGLIELGDTSTFFESVTASVDFAHSENEDMFEGVDIQSPRVWQAHMVHWNIHFHFMQGQEFSYTDGLPQEVVDKFKAHLLAHEYFLYTKAKTNLQLATALSQNPNFPAVLDISNEPPLSHIIMALQAPPPPPAPPMPLSPEGGGGAPLPDEAMMQDMPVGEPLDQGELPPEMLGNDLPQ